MFTGIIENQGLVKSILTEGTNITFEMQSTLTPELSIDESVSHNGVCLTVVAINEDCYFVTAVEETLNKTNLQNLKINDYVNLERAMANKSRFDGHIVQGHVDQTGICENVRELDGSWVFDFSYDFEQYGNIVVEKGSVCINGVSLTVFNCEEGKFSVTIIPYTFEHTNFNKLQKSDLINLEFDIIGKYIQKMMTPSYIAYLQKKK